jgi:hypothetical protein
MSLQRRPAGVLRVCDFVPAKPRTVALLALSVVYVVGVVLVVSAAEWVWLLLVANVGAAVRDAGGYFSLGGRIRWSRVGCVLGVLLVLMWLLVGPGVVLGDGLRSTWRARQRELASRAGHSRALERELGVSRPDHCCDAE